MFQLESRKGGGGSYACTLQCGAARPSRDLVLRVIERIGRRPIRDATASQPCCRYTDGAIDAISECLGLVFAGKPFPCQKKGLDFLETVKNSLSLAVAPSVWSRLGSDSVLRTWIHFFKP